MPESNFDKLVARLKGQGYSHTYATKVAAKAGDEKYGKEAMAKKAAAAREVQEKRLEEAAKAAAHLRNHWMRGQP